jgi:hypothetical protein
LVWAVVVWLWIGIPLGIHGVRRSVRPTGKRRWAGVFTVLFAVTLPLLCILALRMLLWLGVIREATG